MTQVVNNKTSTGYSEGLTSIALYSETKQWFHPLASQCYSDLEHAWKPLGYFQNFANKRLKLWMDYKKLQQELKTENLSPDIFIIKNRLNKIVIFEVSVITDPAITKSPSVVSYESIMFQMCVNHKVTSKEERFFEYQVLGARLRYDEFGVKA